MHPKCENLDPVEGPQLSVKSVCRSPEQTSRDVMSGSADASAVSLFFPKDANKDDFELAKSPADDSSA